jgi:hypothetical protein
LKPETMEGQILNHSENNNRLFGFLPSFLIYENTETPLHKEAADKTYEQIQEEREKRTEALKSDVVRSAEKKVTETNKTYETLKTVISVEF